MLSAFEAHRNASGLGGNRRGGDGGGNFPDDDELPPLRSLARALPLALLLRVCRKVLIAPPIVVDERSMVRALRRAAGALDVALFRIVIRRAAAAGRVLRSAGGESGALSVLRGDALVTPHYRLGVGVNHALETTTHLAGLLTQIWGRGGRAAVGGDGRAAGELVEAWGRAAGADAHALADYQQRVIRLEAGCGLLVFGERVFARGARRALRELGDTELAALKC